MIETVAAVFGVTGDEFVKYCAGIAGVLTAIGTIIAKYRSLTGGRSRAFVKIRRIENVLIAEELRRTGGAPLTGLYFEMREDQRDRADERDADG